ncbi:MAG TPA: glycogen debranching protein GlgX [Paracoccaceae bacterium]|nr:glycogen debranching protein GlgX [Paracoccaceae bacterium]
MRVREGRPEPLGASFVAGGANVAIFSAHAEAIDLCLYDAGGREERVRLPARTGPVWHGHVAGLKEGQLYGLRAHGPWAPEAGQRFNPAKLLLDPYARGWSGGFAEGDAALGQAAGGDDLSISTEDSAGAVPKCVMLRDPPRVSPAERPRVPWADTVVYEAHVKGLTRLWPGLPEGVVGTFDALGAAPVIAHLKSLGVTTLELLPVQAHVDERRLGRLGLTNYWGYSPLGFFVPEPRYLGPGGVAGFREAVRRLHEAGIEVILDVVLNHTGEEDELGPTLSFRGFDNGSYYRLREGGRYYDNPTGCGNVLDLTQPFVLRLAMDSLRWWAERMGVDGFRFDLAVSLARRADGFDPAAPFLAALLQDPVLREVKLIAEPWDVGPGGYRLGGFPAPMAEWNDRFRDHARRFWRGEKVAHELADALLGSARIFDRGGRRPWSSVNLVTAHDGFTLADLVSFRQRRNEANGEGNRDGHGENYSDNCGVEGPTSDHVVRERRARRMRNLAATLFLAQGVPMLRGGDEIGQSQGGNNNAYCQDNEVSWIDWGGGDAGFLAFVQNVAAFRRAHPCLRQARFLHGERRAGDGFPNVEWRAPDGRAVEWENGGPSALGLVLREGGDWVFLVLNAGGEMELVLPEAPAGRYWRLAIDAARPEAPPEDCGQGAWPMAGHSVMAFEIGEG